MGKKVPAKWRKGLIRKGHPHPDDASFKFTVAALTKDDAEKIEKKELDRPSTDATRVVTVPRQHLVFRKPIQKRGGVRITPKRPRIR